jgi:hypothetical protein
MRVCVTVLGHNNCLSCYLRWTSQAATLLSATVLSRPAFNASPLILPQVQHFELEVGACSRPLDQPFRRRIGEPVLSGVPNDHSYLEHDFSSPKRWSQTRTKDRLVLSPKRRKEAHF